jgi:hypothetical protein
MSPDAFPTIEPAEQKSTFSGRWHVRAFDIDEWCLLISFENRYVSPTDEKSKIPAIWIVPGNR